MKVNITAAILLSALFLLSFSASAQIDQSVLDKQGDVCGNNVREHFELCDDPAGRDPGLCTEAGKLLRIAMVCHPKTCGCIPYKNKDCGNGIAEGSEFCDPPAELNVCPELGKIIGIDLECNPSSCMCVPAKGVVYGVGFEPQKEEEKPVNLCGNRQIDFGEQCEPPGRPCMYEDKGVSVQGICEPDCKCEKIPEVVTEQTSEQTNETGKNSAEETVGETTVKDESMKEESAKVDSSNSKEVAKAAAEEPKTGRGIVRVVLGIIILAATAFLVYFFFRRKDDGTNVIDEMEKIEENEEH